MYVESKWLLISDFNIARIFTANPSGFYKHSLISECFKNCDFSKEQCSSLKMILGSKHVGAILNVLM